MRDPGNEVASIAGNWSHYNLRDIVTKASAAFVASADPDVHFKCYRLRWLETVSSTFQDVAFDGSLLPLFIS